MHNRPPFEKTSAQKTVILKHFLFRSKALRIQSKNQKKEKRHMVKAVGIINNDAVDGRRRSHLEGIVNVASD